MTVLDNFATALHYSLLQVNDFIDSLEDVYLFVALVALWEYWKVLIKEEDNDKTTVTSHLGISHYNRMLFDLHNAYATFQVALDFMVSEYRWKTCLVYTNEVVIFPKNNYRHVKDIDDELILLS